MAGMVGMKMGFGQRIDRLATRVLTPVAGKMLGNRTTASIAGSVSIATGWGALCLGMRSWEMGTALNIAANQKGFDSYSALVSSMQSEMRPAFAFLEKSHILANHKFMALHAAALFPYYIDSIAQYFTSSAPEMTLPTFGREVIAFGLLTLMTYHTAIAIHEMGHYVSAVKAMALNPESAQTADEVKEKGALGKLAFYTKAFFTIPWGKFPGVKKVNGNFHPDGPNNLRVAAAGPKTSGVLSISALGIGAALTTLGYLTGSEYLLLAARPFLGLGVVGGIDYAWADHGAMKAYAESIKPQPQKTFSAEAWMSRVEDVKKRMISSRIQEVDLGNGVKLRAPWGFRNCAMGGVHTEKEYPKSNISMQEAMFVPLSATTYEQAQEMTIGLQTRLLRKIEAADGAMVMGIGLEGGLATYIDKEETDIVPEQRLWRFMRDTIIEAGYAPGEDVVIALDPAASELENNYREHFGEPEAVGKYLFWRSKELVIMTREELLALYKKAMEEDNVPIVSIEDGWAEDDHAGWKLGLKDLGQKLHIIGDDLVTTRDSSIESAADHGLTNTALIKANQIGTLTETLLAMLVALGKGQQLVVSHRSKSPNDTLEADIALAADAMGLKAGGGANTERLIKYGKVMKLMIEGIRLRELEASGRLVGDADLERMATDLLSRLEITNVIAYEESTNAGIPSTGVEVSFGVPGSVKYRNLFKFTGATPLGTSAGTGEAIHLVDKTIEKNAITEKYPELFIANDDGTVCFAKSVKAETISEKNDPILSGLWARARRYDGKGTMTAAENVTKILSGMLMGKKLSELGNIVSIDKLLLEAEQEVALRRNKISPNASPEEYIALMQRKGNLGMNAILSLSLALGRLSAEMNGKQLWQSLREEMENIMRKAIAKYEGAEPSGLSFNELVERFKAMESSRTDKETPLFAILRNIAGIYEAADVSSGMHSSISANLTTEFHEILSQLEPQQREKLAVVERIFGVEGSFVYDVEMREEAGTIHPFLKIAEGSKRGIGEDWVSRVDNEWARAWDSKGNTIVTKTIFIDPVNSTRHGKQFEGYHYVAIPLKTGPDSGKIMMMLGRFDEGSLDGPKHEAFGYKFEQMKVWAWDTGVPQSKDTEAKIIEAFNRIPLAEFFTVSTKGLFDTYIKPACCPPEA